MASAGCQSTPNRYPSFLYQWRAVQSWQNQLYQRMTSTITIVTMYLLTTTGKWMIWMERLQLQQVCSMSIWSDLPMSCLMLVHYGPIIFQLCTVGLCPPPVSQSSQFVPLWRFSQVPRYDSAMTVRWPWDVTALTAATVPRSQQLPSPLAPSLPHLSVSVDKLSMPSWVIIFLCKAGSL